jgi:hypothetical protein
MNLSAIVKESAPQREFECELIPGFYVTVAHISKALMTGINKDSEIVKFDAGTKTRKTDTDPVKFNRLVSNAAIKGWRGLTVAGVSALVPVKSNATEFKLTDEVEYSKENATFLLAESADFDLWLTSICFNAALFQDFDREEVEKNSSGSSNKKRAAFEE